MIIDISRAGRLKHLVTGMQFFKHQVRSWMPLFVVSSNFHIQLQIWYTTAFNLLFKGPIPDCFTSIVGKKKQFCLLVYWKSRLFSKKYLLKAFKFILNWKVSWSVPYRDSVPPKNLQDVFKLTLDVISALGKLGSLDEKQKISNLSNPLCTIRYSLFKAYEYKWKYKFRPMWYRETWFTIVTALDISANIT